MPDENKSSTLDVTKMSFPTDALTVGQLRRRQPNLFVTEGRAKAHLSDLEVIPTLAIEMSLAEKTFCRAMSQPDPCPGDTRAMLVQMLNEDYCRLEISSGLHQTRQLARAIESAAVKQAFATTGRKP